MPKIEQHRNTALIFTVVDKGLFKIRRTSA
jgi:hypothetical protein